MSAVELYDTAWLDLQLVRYVSIASAALLAYDHLLTFPLEIELIWKAQWSLGKCLFLANRYAVPIIVGLDMYQIGGLATNLTGSFCKGWVLTEAYALIVSLAIVNLTIAIRLHALWAGPRWLQIVLGIAWFLYVGATIGITTYLMVFEMLPSINPVPTFNICYGDIPDSLFLIWVPATIFEFLTISLTLLRAWHHCKVEEFTLLSHVLYRDGFVYNAVKLMVLLGNVFVFAFASKMLVMLLKEFVLVAVNVIGSRMMLNLRAVPLEKRGTEEDMELWPTIASWSVPLETRHISPRSEGSVQDDQLSDEVRVERGESIYHNSTQFLIQGIAI